MNNQSISHYLSDIITELEDIAEFSGDDYEAFNANRMAQKAVIRSYEIIGEIVKRLPPEIRELYPQVDWRHLAGFRDYLIHRYDTLDLKRVWVAVEDVASLKAKLEAIRQSLPPDDATP